MSDDDASAPGPGGLDWSHMNLPAVPGLPPASAPRADVAPPTGNGDVALPPKPAPPRYAPPQGLGERPVPPAPPASSLPYASAPQSPPYAAASPQLPPYASAPPTYGYAEQGYYAAPATTAPPTSDRRLSLTAGWLGIIGAALSLIPFIGLMIWMLPLAAAIVGIVALSKRADGKGWAVAGVVLGFLGALVLPFGSLAFASVLLGF